ncbi:MAG: low molecular weight phosphotyrosine protein phosphatase [Oscillospiraceae bacterium]|nr:low molecular weight phosphotyrosine protein phosphatase [Oscillospiraceae bacterium]
MIKVLFICHGNICRSPMAEFIFKDMVAKRGMTDDFHIESCATSTEEIWNGVGNPVYPPAKRELAKHGISCDGKRARQVTKADYDKFDYLICMDNNNLRNIKWIIPSDPQNKISKLMNFAGSDADVADPWYTGDFETTYRDIVEGCEGFITFLRNHKYI